MENPENECPLTALKLGELEQWTTLVRCKQSGEGEGPQEPILHNSQSG